MARVVVDVMLKPEILDPQGQAVQRALPRLGFEGISDVRQGKRFELEVADPVDDTVVARIRELAESFLANTVIENFDVRIDASGTSVPDGSDASHASTGSDAPGAGAPGAPGALPGAGK